MRKGLDEIAKRIAAVLEHHHLGTSKPVLMPIEPPRDWGLSTNVCFTLAPRVAKDEIELRTDGLSKKEKKQLAAQITREVGAKLAEELASELAPLIEAGELPFVARVEAEGAYVNFYYDVARLTAHVVETINTPKRTETSALPSERASDVVQQGRTSGDSEGGRASLPALDLTDPNTFGHGAPTGRRIMVEYAQPNTHKDFHVGHLRNASIGQAIANLLAFAGNDVLKATYIGDIGAHVAKAIWAHLFWMSRHEDKALQYSDSLSYWHRMYQAGHQMYQAEQTMLELAAEASRKWPDLREIPESIAREVERVRRYEPEVIQYIDAILQEIQGLPPSAGGQRFLADWENHQGDTLERRIWRDSRDEFLSALKSLLVELKIEFTTDPDCWFFESTIDDAKLGQRTAAELQELGIAVVDESEEYKGALFVDFEQQADALRPDGTPVFRDEERKRIRKLGKMTILRSDGTSLYQTKELGLAKHKFDLVRERYGADLDESLYVVGVEQQLYFQQVFAILRLWGFPNAENCRHVSYELVVLPEGKMSSREGNVVSYRELRDEAIHRAEQLAREKGIGAKDQSGAIDEQKVKAIAHDVAIAAIKYAMLQVTGSQQIVFDFEQALSFSGRAAPYLQYAYARAGKLVEDGVGAKPASPASTEEPVPSRATQASPLQPGYPLDASEIALARLLGEFPSVCAEAAAACEPATLCTYLYELATAFSDFYRDCRVLDAPEPERGFRRSLTAAFRRVMRTGFAILALPLPEEM